MEKAVAKNDLTRVILDELRQLQGEARIIKEQVFKTNGRVTNAEREIIGMKTSLNILQTTVGDLSSEALVNRTINEQTARRITERKWWLEYLQKWGPVIATVGTFLLLWWRG